MSYILDALKKSEAERSSRDHSELARQVTFESAPRRQRELWPYLLAMALMANAAVVAYLASPESGQGEEAAVSAEPAPEERPEPGEQETADTAPEPAVEEVEVPEAPESPEAPDETGPSDPAVAREPSEETPEEVPDISAMPRSVQQRVPEMVFNAHLHSSNPSSRQVMINNRMLREGDRIEGLVIQEITTSGVILQLEDHVFQMDVVRDWQGG